MATGLERMRYYLVGIAERSTGINIAKEYYAVEKPSPDNPHFKSAKRSAIVGGASLGLIQLFMPLFLRAQEENRKKPEPNNISYLELAGFFGGFITDIALVGVTVSMSHNPVELIAFKLAANAASHVGGDLIVGAVDRIKQFRPLNPTLMA